jgi:hypothetical protein
MGIIFPKKQNGFPKALITLLLIILSPLLMIPVLLYFLWGGILYLTIWLTAKKPFVVFVYSDSPTWKDYIEREFLPDLRNRAVILNWSERKHWKNSLAVLAFRYFGGFRNFNPMGMIFRPLRFVETYRFFEAFKEFKHGNHKDVEKLKKELFEAIGSDHG